MSLTRNAAKPRILVVDDVLQNLQVVGAMLRAEGFDVMPAGGGAQALERVSARLPDLILLDLMMPGMDGHEVCRRLKADPAARHIPVIFLTASNEMEHLVQGFQAGAVDYVTKPFNGPELLARVRTHLELKLARERLREMNDEKNEFMGIAAHDLRGPLSAIKGYAEMVLEDAQDARHPEIERNAGKICDITSRMGGMVQNLLDANRIERGEMDLRLTSTDVGAALASVVEGHRSRARAKQQTLCLDDGGPSTLAMADLALLTQVLENLLSNAVKYSPPERNIFLSVKNSEGAVRCEVRDEGPGLTAEDHKKLFGKFARLSAKPTGGENSTGLGLSIVKKMVEAMNGRIWCESSPGQGAAFILTLPAA